MKLKARCPNNPNHSKFVTSAHEAHTWQVDSEGNFLEDRGCHDVTHRPDAEDLWWCDECGEEAIVKLVQ